LVNTPAGTLRFSLLVSSSLFRLYQAIGRAAHAAQALFNVQWTVSNRGHRAIEVAL
jgi:hypothetical protein